MGKLDLRRALLFTAGASILAWSSPTTAQPSSRPEASSAVEEIVVTARRREESLQTTPVAITAVSSETLETRNVTSLEQISQIAPSFAFFETTGGLGSASGYMRGIGYGDNVIGQDAPIGIYIDGIIAGRNAIAVMDLVEPERVEVLRGPQGTLFGRNTTGGAILITSHTPTDEFGGMVKAGYGRFDDSRFQARIDTGLLGDSGIKLSLAYQHHQRNGVHDAGTRPDRLDPGAERGDSYWFKAQGEWDRFRAILTADYSELKGVALSPQIVDATPAVRNMVSLSPSLGGGSYTITTEPRLSIPFDAYAGEQNLWSQGLALTLTYDLSDNLTLKSMSALRAYYVSNPAAYGPADLRVSVVSPGTPRISTFQGLYGLPDRRQGQRQKSQELQLLGSLSDFNFVVGGYYFDEGAWDLGVTRLPSALGAGTAAFEFISTRYYTVDSRSIAGFGQVDWRPSFLDKKLELSGGVRWTKDKREFIELVAPLRSVELKTKNTSFLASANYQWTEGLMTFVRYSTGYRAGGFNVRAALGVNPAYDPEKLKSLEGGFKADFFNRRVRLNGSAYSNTYRDLQATLFIPPSGAAGGGNIAVNANARFKGFELELQTVPIDGLTISASVGHVDPKYRKYPKALELGQVSLGCTPIAANGVTVGQDCAAIASFTQFPKTTVDTSVHYVFPATNYGEWSVFASYSYKSAISFSAFNLPSTPFKNRVDGNRYGLLSARIALSDIPLGGAAKGQIAIFGDNLADKTYVLQGIDFQSFASVTWGTPRTIGIEGKVEF